MDSSFNIFAGPEEIRNLIIEHLAIRDMQSGNVFSWPSSTHRQVNDENFVVCSFERPTELNAVPADIYYEVKFCCQRRWNKERNHGF